MGPARFLSIGLGLCLSFAFSIAQGQPVPRVTALSPEWLQRGVTNEITVQGENLKGANHLLFSGEDNLNVQLGFSSAPPAEIETSAGGITSGDIGDPDKMLHARVFVPADATMEARDVRVESLAGVSNPLTVNFSDQPQKTTGSNNHSPATAQLVSLPAGLNGEIKDPDQTDYFRFHARKEQRLIFDVQAYRLGSALDSSLALLDAKGKELARNEDVYGLDSFIDFTVPSDGEYLLQIRDFRHQGGPNFKYHIDAGPLPYLDSIYPFGGQRGKPVEVKLRGRNLDQGQSLKWFIDPKAPLGPQEIRAHTPHGASNPRLFEIADFAEIMEKEPNDSTNNATMISLPATVNGEIQAAKDQDFFRFKGTKGQRFVFEVLASRFGSSLDAILTLMDRSGKMLQRNDDAGSADARIDFTFTEDGDYFISIRDLNFRGGDNFGYRLAVRPPPPPDFSARLTSDTLRLHRGGRVAARIEATRTGYAGPVLISAEELPPGVTCNPLLITADMAGGFIELEATEEADLGNSPIQFKATAVLNNKRVSKPVQPFAGGRAVPSKKKNAAQVAMRKVKGAFLTVADSAPFKVDWVSLAAQLEQNQSATLQADVTRSPGFMGEIKLSMEGFSAGADPVTKSFDVQPVTLRSNATRADFPIKAKLESETGTRTVVLKAESAAGGESFVEYSNPIPLTVTEFPFVLSTSLPRLTVTALPASKKSAAAEADFSVKVGRRGLFNDDIALSLEGLPEGVVATSTNLGRALSEVTFKLVASDKAPVGKTNSLVIVGTSTVNGRALQQRTAPIALVVNAPTDSEKVVVATTNNVAPPK